MSLKTFLSFVILLLCGLSLYQGGCTIVDLRPKESELENSPIDPISEPIQVNISPDINSSFLKVVDGVKILITPKAYYKISGRVVSKRHYYDDMLAKLSPVDLAIAWGEFSSNKYDSNIKYWHSDRYYSFRYKGGYEGDMNKISTYSANEHLVPSTPRLAKVIKSIKENEIVEIEGQLVNLEWINSKGDAQNFNTSLNRDDTGAGACEVIYVTRIKIKNKVFR